MSDAMIERLTPWPKSMLLVIIAVFALSAMAYIHTENVAIGPAFLCCIVVFLLWVVTNMVFVKIYESVQSNESELSWAVYRILVVALTPSVLVFALASCIFSASLSHAIWIGGDNLTSGRDGIMIAVPFYHNIRKVALSQYPEITVVATTRDGKRIEAKLFGEFQLVTEKARILASLHRFPNPSLAIRKELDRLLTERFKQMVVQYDLAELPPTLVMEWETGSAIEPRLLTQIGVEWAGTLRVYEIHVFFGQVDT